MAVVAEIIRVNEDKSLSFGDYTLPQKTKVIDFEVDGRYYKAKTFNEVTKLKRDGALVYESIPGTTVHELIIRDGEVSFGIEGKATAQITIELQPQSCYKLSMDDVEIGELQTSIAGKANFSIEATENIQRVVLQKI